MKLLSMGVKLTELINIIWSYTVVPHVNNSLMACMEVFMLYLLT